MAGAPLCACAKKGEERHEKEAMGREVYRKMKREEYEERRWERNKRHEMERGTQAR